MNLRCLLFLCTALLGTLPVNGQELYFARDGYVSFFSDAPLEDIKAVNQQVNTIFNHDNGEVVVKVLIRSFEFDKALMQEHFNENYMESSTYPKSIFKGKINNYKPFDLSKNKTYTVKVTGSLTIKGITQEIQETGEVQVKDGKLLLQTELIINLDDYKIKIPGSVVNNISKNIKITYRTTLSKLER